MTKRQEVWMPKIAEELSLLQHAIDDRVEIEPYCVAMRAAAFMAGTPALLDCVNAAEAHYVLTEYQRAHDLIEDCRVQYDGWLERAR